MTELKFLVIPTYRFGFGNTSVTQRRCTTVTTDIIPSEGRWSWSDLTKQQNGPTSCSKATSNHVCTCFFHGCVHSHLGNDKESSFRKVQETLKVVDQETVCQHAFEQIEILWVFDLQWNLQEFQYQLGIKMPGAPSSLQSAGTGGKHPQNIKRDILRKLNRVDPGQGVSEFSIG